MAQIECFYDSLEDLSREQSIEDIEKIKKLNSKSKIPVYSHKTGSRSSIRKAECQEITQEIETDKKPKNQVKFIIDTKKNLLQKVQKKTYSGMLQAKYGANNEKPNQGSKPPEIDSTRSTMGSSTGRSMTARSYKTICDENDPTWETASSYYKYMVLDKKFQKFNNKPDNLYIEKCREDILTSIHLDNLCSISEACIYQTKNFKTYSIKDYKLIKPPVISCGLGPDLMSPERKKKMELKKKMQEYGMKASIRNRVRIIARTKTNDLDENVGLQ